MLDPRLLRAFVAITDHGGFTAAADHLHMTQSTISQQLGRLEESVGHPLIDRAARPIGLTPAGERLIGHARRILNLQEEVATLLADPAGTMSLRLGMPEDVFDPVMGEAFAQFATRHRAVRLDVTTGLSRDITRRYRAGEFDIIVVKEDTPAPDHRVTFTEPMGWYEGIDAPAWPDPLPLVAFPGDGLYRDTMFDTLDRMQRRWYVAFTGSSLNSVIGAVEARLGVSLLPDSTVRQRQVRRCAGLKAERDMAVSLYAWDQSGPVNELMQQIAGLLKRRQGAKKGLLVKRTGRGL